MFPRPMTRPEFHPDDSQPDPIQILDEHIRAGFAPDLALDLVLNELVVRAAEATHAAAAALALVRHDEMVCRAATGSLAPDLGVPLNSRHGLSGACLETHQPQLSVDTEFDPRIDPAVARHLGIRSILIVPVFDVDDHAKFTGVLEVFSATPAAFSSYDQKRLEAFAEQCARVSQAALEAGQHEPAGDTVSQEIFPLSPAADTVPENSCLPEPGLPELEPELMLPDESDTAIRSPHRSRYETWTLVLGSLAILLIIAVSFLIGSRIGWLRFAMSRTISGTMSSTTSRTMSPDVHSALPTVQNSSAVNATRSKAHPAASLASTTTPRKVSRQSSISDAPPDELVVYEKGKVVFRVKPSPAPPDAPKSRQPKLDTRRDSPAQDNNPVVEASSTTKLAPPQTVPLTTPASTQLATKIVWISPTEAGARLLSRTEPEYPPEAVAARHSGNVVLEVQVAEDGSVSSVRPLSGDPLLAVAATQAVRNWRYQPYRRNGRPTQFQTDVTLGFVLPN